MLFFWLFESRFESVLFFMLSDDLKLKSELELLLRDKLPGFKLKFELKFFFSLLYFSWFSLNILRYGAFSSSVKFFHFNPHNLLFSTRLPLEPSFFKFSLKSFEKRKNGVKGFLIRFGSLSLFLFSNN
jgi:hypothetical protein